VSSIGLYLRVYAFRGHHCSPLFIWSLADLLAIPPTSHNGGECYTAFAFALTSSEIHHRNLKVKNCGSAHQIDRL